MRLYARSLIEEYSLLSLGFSLNIATFSSEMGLLSECSLLDFGMVLSAAVLIAVTIKSVYFSRSLVDVSPEKSTEPNASLKVDSVGLIKFVHGVVNR